MCLLLITVMLIYLVGALIMGMVTFRDDALGQDMTVLAVILSLGWPIVLIAVILFLTYHITYKFVNKLLDNSSKP